MHDHELRCNRRGFVAWGGAGFGALLLGGSLAKPAIAKPVFGGDPFSLGVASGDPMPDGVVLWTRLAPDPLAGGGMPDRRVPVQWEVAHDEQFRRVVKRGTEHALPELAHSVHVELEGLEADREYFYRFKAGPELSPVGRTRTAPAPGRLGELRFAFVSCQNYQAGYFTAHRHLAQEDVSVVLHLGDYIYEGGVSATAPRQHEGAEIVTLTDYRNRHALYRSDADLQAAHAHVPFIVTWDDHEVENNYAGLFAQDEAARPPEQETPEAFAPRRAVAYQAYYEHMPLRRPQRPTGPDMQLYRRLRYGGLAEFNVLDTRQYRSNQVCDPRTEPGSEAPCADRDDPARSLPGSPQEAWLYDGLRRSDARWNVVAQQVFMAQRDFTAGPRQTFSMDAWDGYTASRRRLLDTFAEDPARNQVVLTGDVHNNYAADLRVDFDDPSSATVGTEFVGTSITSGGDGADITPAGATQLSENPHIRFFNGQRGYVRCTLTPEQWRSDFRVVPYVTTPGAPISTRASLVVEDGRPGVQLV